MKSTLIKLLFICIVFFVSSCDKEELENDSNKQTTFLQKNNNINPANPENPYDDIGVTHNKALSYLMSHYDLNKAEELDWDLSMEIMNRYMKENGFYNYEMINRKVLEDTFKQNYTLTVEDHKYNSFISQMNEALLASDLNFDDSKTLLDFIERIKKIETQIEGTEFNTEYGKNLSYISLSVVRHSAHFWHQVHNTPNSGFQGIFSKKGGDPAAIAAADGGGAVAGFWGGVVGGFHGVVVVYFRGYWGFLGRISTSGNL
ncbi:hypothetical protein [Aquimarina sediminis]|uniref:hypothetical protein n=1 Tax=Aquimarina sediminis TaxID=2070536 RepID=UPI000CA0865C|nr:hypothetical protein [Aquimarina sediminis]